MAARWYFSTMKTTIDAAGRLVIPKPLREELGFSAGATLDVAVVDGHLEVAIPSRVRIDQGPHGVRFAAETSERLTAQQVREAMERGRR
jgi:AbrB family looped-hinge helix DNA binding protein